MLRAINIPPENEATRFGWLWLRSYRHSWGQLPRSWSIDVRLGFIYKHVMELPQELYVNYINRREKDLAELAEASRRQDVEVFKRIGHQIKGNAESFGFGELTAIAVEIEKITTADINNKNDNIVIEKLTTWVQEKRKLY